MTALPGAAAKHRIQHLAEEINGHTLYSPVTVPRYTLCSPIAVPPALLSVVFLPFVGRGYTKTQCKELMVFALLGKHPRVPRRTVQGFPVFAEVSVWRAEDFFKALDLAAALSSPYR